MKFKKFLLITLTVLSLVSCEWISTNETISMQEELNNMYFGKNIEQILFSLGQPTLTERDSIENVMITKLHYDDDIVFKMRFKDYDVQLTESPYIDIFIKDSKVFSAKSNLQKLRISRNEKTISIIKIASYAGTLLFICFCLFISLMTTRKKKFISYGNDINNMNDFLTKHTNSIAQLKKSQEKTNCTINQLRNDVEHNKRTINKLKESISGQTTDVITNETKEQSPIPEDIGKILSMKIDEAFDFSIRIRGALINAGINTVANLCSYPKNALKRMNNIGNRSFGIIKHSLREYGLELDMDLTQYGYDENGNKTVEADTNKDTP